MAEQLLDRVHRRDQSRLIRRREFCQHRRSVALRAGVERHERFPATDGKRQMALPAVLRRGPSLDQSALFEIAQHAAEISGIQAEAACYLTGSRRTVAG